MSGISTQEEFYAFIEKQELERTALAQENSRLQAAVFAMLEQTLPKLPSPEAVVSEKRDWFAGQAIGAVIEVCGKDTALADTVYAGGTVGSYFARKAYEIADAMLAERSKP